MKKVLIVILILAGYSCTPANQAVFRETGNFNVLDLGSSRVSIDKRFQLVGELKGAVNTDTNVDDRYGTDWRVTRYLFMDGSNGNDKVRRAIVVYDQSMVKSSHYFLGEASYETYKGNSLDKGMTEKLGLRCAYVMRTFTSVSKDLLDLAASKGFGIDKGEKAGVAIEFAKHVGSSRRVQILYMEGGNASQADTIFQNAAQFVKFEDGKVPTPPSIASPPKTNETVPGKEAQQTPKVAGPKSNEKAPENKSQGDKPIVAKTNPIDKKTIFVWPPWRKLDAALKVPPKTQKLEPDKIFSAVSGTVWVVIAEKIGGEKNTKETSLGSAVAVSKKRLVTNCHVLQDSRSISLFQGDKKIEAVLVAADEDRDRCVLSVGEDLPVVAPGFRDFADLREGEKVYSIGSPSGLEKTIGEGLVSGLRTLKLSRLVQTTAPISPGSSGGGLFDRFGNLVGVTTFLLRDAQNLNFAISVSDFWTD